MLDKDSAELLCIFNEDGVKFLVIGGVAVGLHSEVRATKDLDLWVGTDKENLHAVYKALARFGAPLAGVPFEVFSAPGSFFQMGQPPNRVDICLDIPGISFEAAWVNRVPDLIDDGIPASYISADDLITNKIATGRPQDLLDAQAIQSAKKSRSTK